MTFTDVRMALVACLVLPAVVDAQPPARTDAHDFRMFLHSISVRQNARTCERVLPEYRRSFDDLYGKWLEKHRGEVTRGESTFREAQQRQDLKEFPFTNRAAIVRAEEALEELAGPSRATAPAKPAPQIALACEKTLDFLKTD